MEKEFCSPGGFGAHLIVVGQSPSDAALRGPGRRNTPNLPRIGMRTTQSTQSMKRSMPAGRILQLGDQS